MARSTRKGTAMNSSIPLVTTPRASKGSSSAPTAKAKLIEARALIAHGWIQGEYAAKADGELCAVSDPRAAHFCLRGALDRVTGNNTKLANACAILVYDAIQATVMNGVEGYLIGLSGFNDNAKRTQADILAVFDAAIAGA